MSKFGTLTISSVGEIVKKVELSHTAGTDPKWYAAAVTSVVSDSVRPHRRQPTRLPRPRILQARALEWLPFPSPVCTFCLSLLSTSTIDSVLRQLGLISARSHVLWNFYIFVFLLYFQEKSFVRSSFSLSPCCYIYFLGRFTPITLQCSCQCQIFIQLCNYTAGNSMSI